MGKEKGNEFELWPSRFLEPDPEDAPDPCRRLGRSLPAGIEGLARKEAAKGMESALKVLAEHRSGHLGDDAKEPVVNKSRFLVRIKRDGSEPAALPWRPGLGLPGFKHNKRAAWGIVEAITKEDAIQELSEYCRDNDLWYP